MEEDWYTVEQQVRDRLTEAPTAARIRTPTQKLAPTPRRENSVRHRGGQARVGLTFHLEE